METGHAGMTGQPAVGVAWTGQRGGSTDDPWGRTGPSPAECDEVTQLLFSTMLLARASHLKLERTGGAGGRELPEMLADLENMSALALAEMRALLSELRPRTLDGRGPNDNGRRRSVT